MTRGGVLGRVLGICCTLPAAAQPADIVLVNGKMLTLDARLHVAGLGSPARVTLG